MGRKHDPLYGQNDSEWDSYIGLAKDPSSFGNVNDGFIRSDEQEAPDVILLHDTPSGLKLIPRLRKTIQSFRWHRLSRPMRIGLGGALVLALFIVSIWLGAVSMNLRDSSTGLSAKQRNSAGDTDAVALNVSSGQIQGTSLLPTAPQQRAERFEGVETNVTVQRAPDNFQTDPNALHTLATSMKAKLAFANANWGDVYIATTNGVQVALFAHNGALGIVQSHGQHTNDAWQDYITDIKP